MVGHVVIGVESGPKLFLFLCVRPFELVGGHHPSNQLLLGNYYDVLFIQIKTQEKRELSHDIGHQIQFGLCQVE